MLLAISVALIAAGISTAPVPPAGPGPRIEASAAASGFYASPNPVDAGISTTMYASSVCLASVLSSCSFSYTGLPPGCSSSNTDTLTCTPTSPGTYSVSVTATWACPVCLNNSGSTTLSVNSALGLASLSASPSALDAGHVTQLVATVSGGTTPFTYAWSSLPPGCASANSPTLSCTPTSAGSYSVNLTVQDSVGGQKSGSTPLTVYPGVTISAFTISPGSTDLSGSITLAVTASGGSPPISYSFANLPPGCTSTNSASFSCTPTAVGGYTVTATAADSTGATSNATATVAIDPRPSVSLAVSPAQIDLGQSTTFSATVVGGTGGDTLSFTGLPPGCTSANQPTLVCTPTSPSSYAVVVTVVDSSGGQASASASLTVNPQLTARILANVTNGTAPLRVTFTSQVSGGTGPYSYAWQFAPNANSTLQDPKYVFTNGGNYSVSLTVTDAAGGSATVLTVIHVLNPSSLSTFVVTFFVSPPGCGPVTFNYVLQRDGTDAQLPASSYFAEAPKCPGFLFTQWVPTGTLVVGNTSTSATMVAVQGPGSLTAVFSIVGTGGRGPGGGTSALHTLSGWAPYLPLLVGGVLGLFVVRSLFDRRRTGPGASRPGPAAGATPPPAIPPGAWAPHGPTGTTSVLDDGDERVPAPPSLAQRRPDPTPGSFAVNDTSTTGVLRDKLSSSSVLIPAFSRYVSALLARASFRSPPALPPVQPPPTRADIDLMDYPLPPAPPPPSPPAIHPTAAPAPAGASPSTRRPSSRSSLQAPSSAPTTRAPIPPGAELRSWPPSGIWEIYPPSGAPTPKKPDRSATRAREGS